MKTLLEARARVEALLEAMSPGLRAHVMRCVVEARRLAMAWGLDVERAELAALGHDLAREMSGEELLAAAERFGLRVEEVEREEPILLHAKVGAELLRGCGVDDEEVLEAVRCHTTGCRGMGRLALALFLADKMEEEKARKRPSLAQVRALAVERPEQAALLYMEDLIERAARNGWSMHPDLLAAREELARLRLDAGC